MKSFITWIVSSSIVGTYSWLKNLPLSVCKKNELRWSSTALNESGVPVSLFMSMFQNWGREKGGGVHEEQSQAKQSVKNYILKPYAFSLLQTIWAIQSPTVKCSLKSILNRSCTYITFSGPSPTPYHNCKQLPQSLQDYLFVCDIWLSPQARTGALARHRTSLLGPDIKKQIASPHQSSGWVRASCWDPPSTIPS